MVAVYPNWSDIFDLNGNDPDDAPEDLFNRRLLNWMSFIQGDTKLNELAIPGTHDSGTYSMRDWGSLGSYDELAQTQSFNLLGQLLAGVRYLDGRLSKKDGQVIFDHGVVTGRRAQKLFEEQLNPFIQRFPSEFVIIDLQEVDDEDDHSSGETLQDVQTIIKNTLNPDQWAAPSNQLSYNSTLDQIRQNGWRYAVLVRDNVITDALSKGINVEPWIIGRNEFLSSPYDEDIWKSDPYNIIRKVNEWSNEWASGGKNKLFVAQMQETPSNGDVISSRGPLDLEARNYRDHHNSFNDEIYWWAYQSVPRDDVNIVMRDAADWYPEMISNILRINLRKDNVISEAEDEFNILLNASYGISLNRHISETTSAKNLLKVSPVYDDELKNTNWALETGTKDLPNAVTKIYNWKPSPGVGYQEKKFEVNANQDFGLSNSVISYFKLQSNWTDGTNGSFTLDDGWVLQDRLSINLKTDAWRRADWTLTVQAIPDVDPSNLLYYNYDADHGNQVITGSSNLRLTTPLTLYGNDHPDYIRGDVKDDLIKGEGGNDTLSGHQGNDTLVGETEQSNSDNFDNYDDVLSGGRGHDSLIGAFGNDTLFGGRGKDTLMGGSENDHLDGGTGANILTGGEGNDLFVIHDDQKSDIITDFQPDLDKIYFQNDLYFEDISIVKVANGVALTNNNKTLAFLENIVDLNLITISDFI